MNKIVSVFRKEHFNAAHKLTNPEWDAAKNSSIFGKCSYPNFHGHNYELIVKVTGPIDPETGYVMDMKVLSDLIWNNALQHLDHRNLNLDVAAFKNLNPTAENIVITIYDWIRPMIEEKYTVQMRLYETERNYVEYPV